MRNLFHQGAQTSFAPEAKSAVRQLGTEGHAYLSDVHRRVREQIALDFRLPALYSAGMLLTRIWADDKVPDDGMEVEKGHAYWNPHVDKANRASYDYSALLYLNTQCDGDEGGEGVEAGGGCDYESTAAPDFAGGSFAWLDPERDLVIEPRAGRLVTFTGGLENPHRAPPPPLTPAAHPWRACACACACTPAPVPTPAHRSSDRGNRSLARCCGADLRRVSRGTRYVIGMWFTCHEQLQYREDAPLPDLPPTPPLPPRAALSAGRGAGLSAGLPFVEAAAEADASRRGSVAAAAAEAAVAAAEEGAAAAPSALQEALAAHRRNARGGGGGGARGGGRGGRGSGAAAGRGGGSSGGGGKRGGERGDTAAGRAATIAELRQLPGGGAGTENMAAVRQAYAEELRQYDASEAARRVDEGRGGEAGGAAGGEAGGEAGGGAAGADAEADAAWASLWSDLGPLGAPMAPSAAEAEALADSHPEWAAEWGAVLEALEESGAAARPAGGGGGGGGAPTHERRDCGYPGITEAECVQRAGCAPACGYLAPRASRSPRPACLRGLWGPNVARAHTPPRLLLTLARDRRSQVSGTRPSSTCRGATTEALAKHRRVCAALVLRVCRVSARSCGFVEF